MRTGQKKTRRTLRENETIDNVATIEIDIEKNSIGYIKNYQQKFREQNPYYYRTYTMESSPSKKQNDNGAIYKIS